MKPGNKVVSELYYMRVWERNVRIVKLEVKHSVLEEGSEQWLSQQVGANGYCFTGRIQ
jgi:hypothetical protein